jgi:hypothetical protein
VRGKRYGFLTKAHSAYIGHYVEVLRDGPSDIKPGEQRQHFIDMDAVLDAAPDVPKPDFRVSVSKLVSSANTAAPTKTSEGATHFAVGVDGATTSRT